MIIRSGNEPELKGTFLRGFNRKPADIKEQINRTFIQMEEYKNRQNNIVKDQPKMFDPNKQREIMNKMNRLNK